MFAKLALRNVRRQISNYLIYFVTVALSIALLFAVNNLSYSDRIQSLSEMSADIRSMFTMVTGLIAVAVRWRLLMVCVLLLRLVTFRSCLVRTR